MFVVVKLTTNFLTHGNQGDQIEFKYRNST